MPPRKRGSQAGASRRIHCRKGKSGYFRLTNHIQEHHGKPIYCIAFCNPVTDVENECRQQQDDDLEAGRRRSVSRGTSVEDFEEDTETSTPHPYGTDSASIPDERAGRHSAPSFDYDTGDETPDTSMATNASVARTTDEQTNSSCACSTAQKITASATAEDSQMTRNHSLHGRNTTTVSVVDTSTIRTHTTDQGSSKSAQQQSRSTAGENRQPVDIVSDIIFGNEVSDSVMSTRMITSGAIDQSNMDGYWVDSTHYNGNANSDHQVTKAALLHRIRRLFATCGSNQLTIYENKPRGKMEPLQCYIDEDKNEEYFTCAWAPTFYLSNDVSNPVHNVVDDPSAPLLAVAGDRGLIRIINPSEKRIFQTLQGHGNSINHVVWHPTDRHILLSVSKDESVRLWNVENGACIAIFAGENGHRDEVLAADFHPLGQCFASSGMDNTVKLWALDTPEITQAIEASYSFNKHSNLPFSTVSCQFPAFSTTKVHVDYVDHVLWVGNMLLSKSTANHAVLWYPDIHQGKEAATVVREYGMHDATLWFVRMALNPSRTLLASGNGVGNLFVWEIDGDTSPTPDHCLAAVQNTEDEKTQPDEKEESRFGTVNVHYNVNPLAVLTPPNARQATIRHTSFSCDGNSLLYVTDDGKIWRWDLYDVKPQVRKNSEEEPSETEMK